MNFTLYIALCFLSGCASIVTGNHQKLSVQTTPINGARCELTNQNGTWSIASTPGEVTIHRDHSNLVINCFKETYDGDITVKSKMKGLSFVGGVLGVAVDMGTGAAYDYPNLVTVKLKETQSGA